MRILQVTASLDPRSGGVAEAVRQIGAALVRAGHETEVMTTDAPGADWLTGLPFPVETLGPGRGGVYQYASALGQRLRLRRQEFDCVLSHGLWQYHGFATWRAWQGATTPRFVFSHGMLDPWFKRTYPRKHLKKWLYWPWAEYRLLRSARAVFFTCEEERRLARESFWLYRTTEAVNPLGIQEPPGNAEQQKAAFFEEFPELRGKRLIVFLGRLVTKKGCDLLLRAFANLQDRPANIVLVMAGPDDDIDPAFTKTLRESTAGQPTVCWPGMLTGDLKWGALHAAEVFILPSHQENFGLAVVEALACGKPVLVSDKVNIWRELEADHAGFVADDTVPGIEMLLRRWFALSDDERAAMNRLARASFASRYQIDHATASLVEQLRRFGATDSSSNHFSHARSSDHPSTR